MILLDTDTLSILDRQQGDLYERLAARLDAVSDEVCVTVVSVEERCRGCLAWIAGAKKVERLIQGYRALRTAIEQCSARPIIPYDEAAHSEFQALTRVRIRIGTMDLRIAAVALSRDALLLTRNLRNFAKVPRLRAEDWTE